MAAILKFQMANYFFLKIRGFKYIQSNLYDCIIIWKIRVIYVDVYGPFSS